MNDAEIMTIVLVAALFFGGNDARACAFVQHYTYMRRMLSPSRFNRRLQRIKALFLTIFVVFAEHWKHLDTQSIYLIDSFPIASCDNIRIRRSRRYHGAAYRGHVPGTLWVQRRYFYGLRGCI